MNRTDHGAPGPMRGGLGRASARVHVPWRKAARRLLLGIVLGAFANAIAGERAREVHGSSDAFASEGVALAWAVLRGTTEANTVVVMRIARDEATFPGCAVTATDPFSGQSRTILERTSAAGALDVRTPRQRFADFPRTDVKLYAKADPALAAEPARVVYYLGLPDTTPEFQDEAALLASLEERLARARATRKGKPP